MKIDWIRRHALGLVTAATCVAAACGGGSASPSDPMDTSDAPGVEAPSNGSDAGANPAVDASPTPSSPSDGNTPTQPSDPGSPAPSSDSGAPTDASTPSTPTAPSTPTTPATPASAILPEFDAATDAHVRTLVAQGAARGNAHDVMSKIGDSITESGSFLFDCGYGWYDLGTHPELRATIDYFSAHVLADSRNSLNRQSECATAGWTTGDALDGGANSPLARELADNHPQWAIVMYGTNDIDRSDLATFQTNMDRIVDTIEANGTVPVLSTIPDRHDTARAAALVPQFNAAIHTIANARHIPLLDFNLALSTLPSEGVSADGIHPNSFLNSEGYVSACYFTDAALQYGYNVRSLTAIQMLDRLRSMY